MPRKSIGIGVVTLMLSSSLAFGAEVLGNDTGWKLLTLPHKKPTRFRFVGRDVLLVNAGMSVAFYYRALNPRKKFGRRIAWRWRVDRTFPATDQAAKGGDDRPIAIHLWFEGRDGSRLGSLSSLLGRPRVGYQITYVWGGRRARGSIVDNPYYKKGAIIIVRNGGTALGHWYVESRDIVADFKRAFGFAPDLTTLRYVAVSGDTDDTAATSAARIADIRIFGSGTR